MLPPLALSNAAKAGILIFVGAIEFSLGFVLAEILYSAYGPNGPNGYSVSANYISDLGATCPTLSTCYIPPSALTFDASIALFGILVLFAAYFFHRAFKFVPATGLVLIAGLALIGVGTFNETTGYWHDLFSVVTFLSSGLTAVVFARFMKKPMNYFSVILGLATLVAMLLYIGSYFAGLGAGGMERMVVYPVLLWTIGYGGYLMATEAGPGR